jgi:hypothetical protein
MLVLRELTILLRDGQKNDPAFSIMHATDLAFRSENMSKGRREPVSSERESKRLARETKRKKRQ